MEMNIGTNIKRLRLAKDMTQEQLASLLSVSTAAVSKWEARNTYPDVTLLFPLAELFGVTIDELLGYDEAKAKADVDAILSEYRNLGVAGNFAAREKLIRQARKKYPHDFRVMVAYMRELGGFRGKSCRNVVKAQGGTDAACRLRPERVPERRSAVLCDRNESQAAPRRGRHRGGARPARHAARTADAFSERTTLRKGHARTVRFDPALSLEIKTTLLEEIAATYAKESETPKTEFFMIGEAAVLGILFTILITENGTETDVIRVCEKRFAALKKMDELAQIDEVLQKQIAETYQTQGSILTWEIDRLKTAAHPRLAQLRERPAFRETLAQYTR